MRIGFALHYRRHDNVSMAFRLAKHFMKAGHDVSFFAQDLVKVDREWDKLLCAEDYLTWLRRHRLVVWPEAMEPDFVAKARDLGVKSVVLGLWGALTDKFRDTYVMATSVVCPSSQAAALFRENWELDNVWHIPWDPDLPLTRKSGSSFDATHISLLFPLQQLSRVHSEVFALIEHLLEDFPNVNIGVLTSKIDPVEFNRLKRIERVYGQAGQFHWHKDVSSADAPIHYGKHDLVVWPTEAEDVGFVGLEALAMGTPVLAYDVAPINEYLHDQKNAILVPCNLSYNWFGTPRAKADWKRFAHDLTSLLDDPDQLLKLQRATRLGLAARKAEFTNGWQEILDAA